MRGNKRLKQDYTVKFMRYGEITVPKGTRTTHQTASGIDEFYNFVDEYGWIDENYPDIKNILKMDVSTYGINVPAKFLETIE